MNKLKFNKKYEFTITAPNITEFTVEFSILEDKLSYNITLTKLKDDVFELIVPKLNLQKSVNYKIYLLSKNNRFIIDSGIIEIINDEFTTELETVAESAPIENIPIKRELLRDLIRKSHVNDRVSKVLEDLKSKNINSQQ